MNVVPISTYMKAGLVELAFHKLFVRVLGRVDSEVNLRPLALHKKVGEC